jgi:hypothetical protein
MRSATTAQDSTVSLAISTSTGAMGAENLHRAHQFASAQCLVDGIPTE